MQWPLYNAILHCYCFRERASEGDEHRVQETEPRKQRRIYGTDTVQGASYKFVESCKCGPDYVCLSCHRLMYRQTVVHFVSTKYRKVSEHVLDSICPKSVQDIQAELWICVTCDRALKHGNFPPRPQATVFNYKMFRQSWLN